VRFVNGQLIVAQLPLLSGADVVEVAGQEGVGNRGSSGTQNLDSNSNSDARIGPLGFRGDRPVVFLGGDWR
jgi:hypothetical protein